MFLKLNDCRGQTYDGASNVMRKHSGVFIKISEEQLKAIETHCQGHLLSLAVKPLTKECPILRDTMGTVGEICFLVKYSPKREKVLSQANKKCRSDIQIDEQQATKFSQGGQSKLIV